MLLLINVTNTKSFHRHIIVSVSLLVQTLTNLKIYYSNFSIGLEIVNAIVQFVRILIQCKFHSNLDTQ